MIYIFNLLFLIFWIKTWFDLLSQLLAPFEKFVILSRKKTLALFPALSIKNEKKKFSKKIFLNFRRDADHAKKLLCPLYSGIDGDKA